MERCKACVSAYKACLRAKDPQKFDAPFKSYKARNRERVRDNATRYARTKRAADPKFRFRCGITRLVGTVLRRRGSSKLGASFFAAIGYTPEDLFAHIERQFLPMMKWENYGSWHLDHIVPNADFKYRSIDDPEFKACWALSNLRPLWKQDNLKKGRQLLTLL